jgi:ABC-type antimicrobial peptide transport system permease subunit
VVRQGAAPLLGGLVAGLALAAGGVRLLRGLLYGVPPTDPATFAAVTAVLLLGGLAAAYVPARRASRIDPIAAMRTD